jgi:hypothetical protein
MDIQKSDRRYVGELKDARCAECRDSGHDLLLDKQVKKGRLATNSMIWQWRVS